MKIIVSTGDRTLSDSAFERQDILIGSEAGCGVRLVGTDISALSAVISPTGEDSWQIEQVDPEAGITINRQPLTGRATLQNGDTIELHDYRLSVEIGEDSVGQNADDEEPVAEETADKSPNPASDETDDDQDDGDDLEIDLDAVDEPDPDFDPENAFDLTGETAPTEAPEDEPEQNEAKLSQPVIEEPRLSPEELAKIKQFPLPAGSLVKRISEDVALPVVEFDRAAQASLRIARSRDMHELIENAVDALIEVFKARAVWIGIRLKSAGEIEVQGGRLSSGQPTAINRTMEILQYRCVERSQYVLIRRVRDGSPVGAAMGVPLTKGRGTMGMIYVDRTPRDPRFHIPDLDLLSVIAAQVTAKLEAVVHQEAQRSAEVSSAELSVASSIQTLLDPKSAPVWDHLQLSAYTRAGQSNPGDVYDIMKHPDLPVTSLVLAHVNAEGAALALSMVRLQSVFRAGFLHKDRPHALARALGWMMGDARDQGTVDALFLMLDPATGKIQYSRGGKIGAFIVSPKGEPRPVAGVDAPPIGQGANFEYNSAVDQIHPGESLVLYTRGVATCTNEQGERFSEARFINVICDSFSEPANTIVQDVSAELTTFFEKGTHPDDITLLILQHRRDA